MKGGLSILAVAAAMTLTGTGKSEARNDDDERGFDAVSIPLIAGATHAYDFPLPARTNWLGHFMTCDAGATEANWHASDAFSPRL